MQLGLSLALTQTRNIGVASAPSRFSSSWWTLTDAGTGGTLTVTINSLPYNGGSALTDIEYQVDGAGWVSSGLTGIGSFNITGLTAALHQVALRAVNALGKAVADYSFGGSTPQFVIDDAAQYYLSQTGTTAASARTVTMTDPVTVRDADGLWKHSAHNLLSYPSEFADTYWSKTGASVSGGDLVEDTSTGLHRIFNNNAITVVASTEYTNAVEVYPKGRTRVHVLNNNLSGGIFDLTGSGSKVSGVGSIKRMEDGYYRITVEKSAVTSAERILVYLDDGTGNSYTGDGVSGVTLRNSTMFRSDLGGMQNNPDTGTSFVGGTGTGPFFARPVEYATDGSASMPIAPGATNILTNGNDFTLWSQVYATVTAAASVGVDGQTSMSKIVPTTTNASHSVYESPTFLASTTYTLSNTFKAAGYSWAALNIYDGANSHWTWFDLSTGVMGVIGASEGYTIKDLGGGIYRCSITVTTAATGTPNFRCYVCQADGTLVFAGDGTSGIDMGHAQLEAGSFPTPYIPTNGAVTSRAAIQASSAKAMIGTDASLTKGTWVMGFEGVNSVGDTRLISGSGLQSPLFLSAANQIRNYSGSSTLTKVLGSSTLTDGGIHRAAIAFEDTVGRSIGADGEAVTTDTTNYLDTNPPTSFWWMQRSDQTRMPGGSMLRGVMFPNRLSDADLASITDAATVWPSWGEKSATPT